MLCPRGGARGHFSSGLLSRCLKREQDVAGSNPEAKALKAERNAESKKDSAAAPTRVSLNKPYSFFNLF